MHRPYALTACGVLFLTVGVAVAQSAGDSRPAASNVPNAQYPRVAADGAVTFRVKAPGAQKVEIQPLNGNVEHTGFNGLGKQPYEMSRDADGNWTVTTPPAVPGFHYYSVLIDGAILNDPSSETFFGAGRELSGVEVPEQGADFYLPKAVPHGQLRTYWYYSKITSAWRRSFVYTPPGYDAHPAQRYPVLYLRHGGGEDETGWIRQGRVNFILDNLLAAGRSKPMIVVMDSGYATLPGQAVTTNGGGAVNNTIERVTMEELIPAIDGEYRTLADREHRAMAGLSMGSAQTLTIGLAHLDKFSAIGVFSRPPAQNFDIKTAYGGAMADTAAFNRKLHVFFWGAGTAETGIFEGVKATRAAFDQAGVRYRYVEYPGLSHEWQSWRKQLNDFAPSLFQW